MDRLQFLRTAGSVIALPWLELFTPTTPTPVPAKVTRVEIEQVRSADVEAHQRPELFAAVAHLAAVAGFMAFDAYAHDDARHCFRFSLACAEQSGNWHVRARVLNAMARQAIWCGRPDDGLTHIELALVRNDRLSAREKAALHTLRARALAKLGRVQDCLAAVGAADEAFSRANAVEDPPWMVYYDHAQHHGDTGHALFDLSVGGRRTQAAQRLAYSVAHHGPSYARSCAISRTKLASLLMVTGDPRQAAAIGQAALHSAEGLRSKRAADDLRELHRLTGRHMQIVEAVELRNRIAEELNGR